VSKYERFKNLFGFKNLFEISWKSCTSVPSEIFHIEGLRHRKLALAADNAEAKSMLCMLLD
jgi:hypothetical protein